MGVAIPLGYVEDRASGALVVDGSLRFDSSKSHRLARTPGSAGNQKTWTWSGWVKRSNLGTNQFLFGSSTLWTELFFNTSNQLQFYAEGGSVPGGGLYLYSNAVFRDLSAWMHIVWVVDTTQPTTSDRIKVYTNGVQLTWTSSLSFNQNLDLNVNSTNIHGIGSRIAESNLYLNGCLTNIHFIDGQALDPSYFGYTDALTNTWRPKKFKPQATPNNGTTWSSSGNFSGNVRSQGDSYGPPKMFNGIIGNESTTGAVCFAPYSSDSTCTWTSPTTFTGLTSLRLYVDLSGTTGKLTVNGVDYSSLVTALSGGDGWITIPQSSLSTISFGYTGGLNSATGIAAVEVNGVTLLDSDTTNIGTNGFFLPFDGSAPIGQDQSGRGNNWTPVNFGGSNTLEKATGALPILNTDGGGKVARVGVRTDSSASSLVLALPLVGIKSDFSNAVNSGTSNKATTVTTSSFSSADSIFYGGSLSMASGYVTVTDSSDFNFGTGSYTVECWVNVTSGGAAGSGFIGKWYAGSQGTTNGWLLYRGTNGSLYFVISADGINGTDYTTAASTVPTNKWVHCAACYDASTTTLRLFVDGVVQKTQSSPNTPATVSRNVTIGRWDIGDGTWSGYIQDVRIYKGLAKYTQNFIPASTDPDILPDTPSGVSYTSNLTQITDGAVALDGSGDYLSIADSADFDFGSGAFTVEGFAYFTGSASQQMLVGQWAGGGSQLGWVVMTSNNSSRFIRFLLSTTGSDAPVDLVSSTAFDLNKWNHFALTRSGNTFYLFIDGILATSTTSASTIWNSTDLLTVGATSAGTQPFTGFLSNLHVVKGTALYTSNFTPPTGPISSVANTKLLCCKSNSSATAFDVSPGTITANGNAAATNFNPFTVNINTQRGKQSGYATWNPLDSSATISNGNLKAVGASAWKSCKGTVSVSSGKWYYEGIIVGNTYGTSSGSLAFGLGWMRTDKNRVDEDLYNQNNQNVNTLAIHNTGGYNNFGSYNATVCTPATGDVIGIVLDKDNNTYKFYLNGVVVVSGSLGNTTAELTPWTQAYYTSSYFETNFGQKPFKFPPPAGFQPLALANTPRPTIVRPDQFVGIVTYYAADGVAGIATGLSFKPDLVWVKSRTSARSNVIVDSVRGTSSVLWTNLTDAQLSSSQYVSQFNSNGFNYGVAGDVTNNSSLVGWCWKAGGNSNTYNINDVGYATASAAGLTAGTITPTGASVNTKSGFSIVSFTSDSSTNIFSVAHGLQNTPKFVIVKSRDNGVAPWYVYHSSLATDNYLRLNGTNATASDGANQWGNGMTSSVIGLRAGYTTVASTATIAYCWAEIPGFSKFGSYIGNASADGPVVYLGFRPRFVIIKCSSTSNSYTNWDINDSARNTYNAVDNTLCANLSDAENSANIGGQPLDFLANGFKIRQATSSSKNLNNATYIYAAFAETPTQNLYGAQANAR